MKTLLLVSTILFYAQITFCQQYKLYPEMQITSLSSNEGEVTLMNGDVVEGTIGLVTIETSSGLQRITGVRVSNKGEKRLKYKSKEIKEIKIEANWSDQTSSDGGIQSLFHPDLKSEYYIFKSVSDKKGKPRLMQLINPGFEEKIQVFVDAKAKDSSFASMTGKDSAKSYYIIKGDSQKGTYIKKSKYKKEFKDVFGDCSEMMSMFGDKVKWGDFAQHIIHYDQNCK